MFATFAIRCSAAETCTAPLSCECGSEILAISLHCAVHRLCAGGNISNTPLYSAVLCRRHLHSGEPQLKCSKIRTKSVPRPQLWARRCFWALHPLGYQKKAPVVQLRTLLKLWAAGIEPRRFGSQKLGQVMDPGRF